MTIHSNQNQLTDTIASDKRPTHTLFVSVKIGEQNTLIKVGAAWKHKTGNGLNISLDKLVAFENKNKE